MTTSVKTYKFAEFILNPAKRTLFRENTEVKLRDKDFEVLLFLIESAPETRSSDAIIKAVWDETSVENNSVEKAIAAIRSVLGDDVKSPRFIKTIRTRGYLFIGEVEEIRANSSAESFLEEKDSIENSSSDSLKNFTKIQSKTFQPRKILLYSGVFIITSFLGLFLWKGNEIWARFNREVIFADDFSGKEIDLNRWTIKGKSVRIENGIAKLIAEETDNAGKLESALLSFDRNKPVIIKSRFRISPSKHLKDKVYFVGMFGITPKTPLFDQAHIHNEYGFGVKYTNHDYESRLPNGDLDNLKTEGFFLFKNSGAPFKKVDYRDGKVSNRIESVWDKWFEQEIIYEPSSGKMSYTIDGNLKEIFNVGDLLKEMDEDKLRIEIDPAGWWLYHTIEVDYVEITQ